MHEIWITKLFNDYLAGAGNAALALVGQPAQARPWANFTTMELLVAVVIMVLFAWIRSRLSADKPGKLQQSFELIYEFLLSRPKTTSPTMPAATYPISALFFCLYCSAI